MLHTHKGTGIREMHEAQKLSPTSTRVKLETPLLPASLDEKPTFIFLKNLEQEEKKHVTS